jgi:PIN domain nuclease of toxin-antitoxin system
MPSCTSFRTTRGSAHGARWEFLAPKNDFRLSVASVWEMAIKGSMGKLKLPQPLALWIREQLAANRVGLQAIELVHATKVAELPFHHRDPFDRLLAAQAICERKREALERELRSTTEVSRREVHHPMGAFNLKPVRAGSYDLVAISTDGIGLLEDVRVDEGAHKGDLLIRLVPGARVRGRVVDEGGAPVVGAPVYASVRSTRQLSLVRTDAAGAFQFENLLPGSEVHISARAPNGDDGAGDRGLAKKVIPQGATELDVGAIPLVASGSRAAAQGLPSSR